MEDILFLISETFCIISLFHTTTSDMDLLLIVSFISFPSGIGNAYPIVSIVPVLLP